MRFVNPNPNPNSNEYRSNLNRRTSNVPYGKFTVLLCLEKGEGTRIEKCTTAACCNSPACNSHRAPRELSGEYSDHARPRQTS